MKPTVDGHPRQIALVSAALLAASCGDAVQATPSEAATERDIVPASFNAPSPRRAGEVEVPSMDQRSSGSTAGDLGASGSTSHSPASTEPVEAAPVALLSGTFSISLQTSLGDITLEVDANAAPLAATNFVLHSRRGYYDGVTFHRVIPDFMIQSGDPGGTGTGGESVFGARFEDEFDNGLRMDRGALAMANSGPNTNGSQFFIVQAQGGARYLEGVHTIFGRVTAGMDVVDSIAHVAADERDRPLTPVAMTPIEL